MVISLPRRVFASTELARMARVRSCPLPPPPSARGNSEEAETRATCASQAPIPRSFATSTDFRVFRAADLTRVMNYASYGERKGGRISSFETRSSFALQKKCFPAARFFVKRQDPSTRQKMSSCSRANTSVSLRGRAAIGILVMPRRTAKFPQILWLDAELALRRSAIE